MKQPTPELLAELKAYVFSAYYNQPVQCHLDRPNEHFKSLPEYAKSAGWFLELKSLSSITDSEAIEAGFTTARHFNNCKDAYNEMGEDRFYREFIGNNIVRYQTLQQSGFALPIYFKGVQYSVEQLCELGIYGELKSNCE